MAKKDDKGNWIDPTGAPVPPKYIRKEDKARDRMVTKILKQARKLQADLSTFRELVDSEADRFLDGAAKAAGISRNEGGNYTFTDFSGSEQVEIKQVTFISFDERLQLAKQIIDECLERWSDGANANLRAVVFDAFKVDTKGRVDTKRVLGLRRLKITDERWHKAMELIGEAIQVDARRAYILLRERDQGGAWRTIRLDLAAT